MSRSVRWLVAVPLLAGVLTVGALALRWGQASVHLWNASESFEALVSQAGEGPWLSTYEEAMGSLDRADRLRPGHPDQLDLRGQLHHWRAAQVEAFGSARSEGLQQAVELYRDAVRQRPAWPYFWANLAAAKAELGLFDQEFRRALRRAVETGPWESQVQMRLLRIDFIERDRLDRRSRDVLDTVLERALRIQPRDVFALAEAHGEQARVCERVIDPYLEARCAPWRDAAASAETAEG